MVSPDCIFRYFPELTPRQKTQIEQLGDLYAWHNQRVNLISRKDMEMFYVPHVLHSLSLAKKCSFPSGSQVIDIGTGGGFPGIPLAIVFPDVNFTMCDSIGKKIMVVNDVIEQLELHNSQAINSRTETINLKFDIATARAVAPAINLWNWMNGQWRNKPRFYLLKGGDLTEELNELRLAQPRVSIEETAISTLFEEPFFETKKVISIG